MIGLLMILVLAGLVGWGIYLYQRVNKLDRLIARHHGPPSEGDDAS